jgi:hypothetical protein
VLVGDEWVHLADRWELEEPAVVEIRLVGERSYTSDYVRISFRKKGKIHLSDGSAVRVLEHRDVPGKPRWARHKIEPKGEALLVYNSYVVTRNGRDFIESWTGNAGMIVDPISPTTRRYRCSNGIGPFSASDIHFEVSILPAETLWQPKDIY